MKPWRERVKASGLQPDPDTAAAWDRQDAVAAAALSAFGNHTDADAWVLRHTDAFGGWQSPWSLAAQSDAGLQRVRDHLADLARTFSPRPPEELERSQAQRKGRVRGWKPRR